MILTTITDHFVIPLSIAARIRTIFFFFALISVGSSVMVYTAPTPYTDFLPVYMMLLPLSFLACMVKVFRPSIGDGSLYLLPMFIAGLLRITDFWLNVAQGDTTLEMAARGTVGWTFLLISIAYIDLLESRIYHRMVHYLEEETD